MNTAQNHNPVVIILTTCMIHLHLIPHPEEEEEGKIKSDNQQRDKEEGFHSVFNHFAPKMIAYSYVGMYCRYGSFFEVNVIKNLVEV